MSSDLDERETECLNEFKALLKAEKGIKFPLHDDEFLLRFVRARKYNSAKCFDCIKRYYKRYKERPHYTARFFPSEHKYTLLESGIFGKLKHKDSLGRPIVVADLSHWDPKMVSVQSLFTTTALLLEEVLTDVDAQKIGIVGILNYENLSLRQVTQFSISDMRMAIDFFQGSFPMRLKATHVLHQPLAFNLLWAMMKPFMSAKHRNRYFVHGYNYEQFHESISPNILPKSMGGTLSEDDAWDSELIAHLFEKDEYYREMTRYGYT